MARRLVKVVLLAFVGCSLVYWAADEWRRSAQAAARPADSPVVDGVGDTAPATAPAIGEADLSRIAVYYFHGRQRCRTCRLIEAYTRQTLDESYPDLLSAERVVWRIVNYDEPEHQHFISDYGLSSSGVVLVEERAGRAGAWRRLDAVWDLVSDELRFKSYVESQVDAMLEPGS